MNNWGILSHHIALLFFNMVWIYLSLLIYFSNFVCFHMIPHIHIISTYSNTCVKMYRFLIKTGIIIQILFSIFVSAISYENLSQLSSIIKVKVNYIMDHYLLIYAFILICLVNAIVTIPRSQQLTPPKKVFFLWSCYTSKWGSQESSAHQLHSCQADEPLDPYRVQWLLQSGTRIWWAAQWLKVSTQKWRIISLTLYWRKPVRCATPNFKRNKKVHFYHISRMRQLFFEQLKWLPHY